MESEKIRIGKFIIGLCDRTAAGKIKWANITPEVFFTDVKNIRVCLSVRETESFDDVDYIAKFLSLPENDVIFEYTDVDLKDIMPRSYSTMRELYQQARLSAFGYKSKLDEALDDFLEDDSDE